jgi:solute carrier family 24 (sodium/potassium/calcium exchanger), member 4
MAVSNAVGSNVFDILVCLGLPWFIQTAIIEPGSRVNVISKGNTNSNVSLLSSNSYQM